MVVRFLIFPRVSAWALELETIWRKFEYTPPPPPERAGIFEIGRVMPVIHGAIMVGMAFEGGRERGRRKK